MGSVTSTPTTTVLGTTVDKYSATKSRCQSRLTLLLADATRRLASELADVRPPAHADATSYSLTIFAPTFEPKTGILNNTKVLVFATEHLRCTLTSLNLLADLQRRVVGPWRHNLAAVRSQVQSRAKSKKNKYKSKHDSEAKLAELLGRLLADTTRTDGLRAVGEEQSSLLRELREAKSELEEKLSSHNKWKGRWNAIYAMAFFTALAGSVALAAVAAPAPAMTAATVVSAAMKAAEPWFDARWDDRKAALEGEKDVMKAMVRDVSAQLHALESVRVRIDKLKIEVGSLSGRGGYTGSFFFDLKTKEEYDLAFEEVEKGIEALGDTADGIGGDVKKAAAVFLRMIAHEA